MTFLVSTTKKLIIIDDNLENAYSIDSNHGVYYGISFSEKCIYVAGRRSPYGIDLEGRVKQKGIILCYDFNFNLVDILEPAFPLRDIHQLCWYDNKLWVCNTHDNMIAIYDEKNWNQWYPFGKPTDSVNSDTHHINSIFIDNKYIYLVGNKNKAGKIYCFDISSFDLVREFNLGFGSHNCWYESQTIYTLSSLTGEILSENGLASKVNGFLRGAIITKNFNFIGVSENFSNRDQRPYSDSQIIKFSKDWEELEILSISKCGMIHDMRKIGDIDLAHLSCISSKVNINDICFLYPKITTSKKKLKYHSNLDDISLKDPRFTTGNRQNFFKKVNLTSALKYNYGNHRSGWSYAINSLRDLHNQRGIFVDGFIEKKFNWGTDPGDFRNNPEPYKQPWIGFIHCPPNMPKWFNYELAPQSIFSTQLWQESVKYCQGLFCLSEYHKRWLEKHLNIPIASLIHPTEIPKVKFSMDRFLSNPEPKIVQVGWWLRKLHSIYYLPVNSLRKAILDPGRSGIDKLFEIEKKLFELKPDNQSVELINYLTNFDYDDLLSKNIVYLDLYDASANNSIIECIVRNTPVLVNPLPAVREYLGEEYPFYFCNLKEAAEKASQISLIEETYLYLKNYSFQNKLTSNYFADSLVVTKIFQDLPT